jgi:hypothetical protein
MELLMLEVEVEEVVLYMAALVREDPPARAEVVLEQ